MTQKIGYREPFSPQKSAARPELGPPLVEAHSFHPILAASISNLADSTSHLSPKRTPFSTKTPEIYGARSSQRRPKEVLSCGEGAAVLESAVSARIAALDKEAEDSQR